MLIVCLSPSAADLEESANTLTFASRAANICNRPALNVRVTPVSNIRLMAPTTPVNGHLSGEPQFGTFEAAQQRGLLYSNKSSSLGTEGTQTDSNEEALEDELFKFVKFL